MIKTTTTVIINHRNCPYSFNGENLANLRRSQLEPIAAAVGIVGDMPKNDMLTKLLAKLNAMNAEKELTDLKGL